MAKTLRSRIAAVVSLALSIGMLSAVPSSAAGITNPTLGTPSLTAEAVAGSKVYIAAPFTVGTMASGDTFTISARVISAPSGAAVATGASTAGDDIDGLQFALGGSGGKLTADSTTTDNSITFTAGSAISGTNRFTGNAIFTIAGAKADKVGTYQVAIFTDGSGAVDKSGAIKSGDTVKYFTFTLAAARATTATLSLPSTGTFGTYESTARPYGAVVKVQLTDGTNPAHLGPNEMVTLTVPSGLTLRRVNGDATAAPVTAGEYNLLPADFNATATAYVNVTATSASTYTLSAKVAGQTTVSQQALTYVTPDAVAGRAASTASYGQPWLSGGVLSATNNAKDVSGSATSTSVTAYSAKANTSKYLAFLVEDTDFKIFGKPITGTVMKQDQVAKTGTAAGTTADSYGYDLTSSSISVKAQLQPMGGASYTFKVWSADSLTAAPSGSFYVVFTGVAAAADYLTITPASTIRVVNGGTVTITANCSDQFDAAVANEAITAQITSGRNIQATATNLVTNADGDVTFTVTDTHATSTTTSDTVTFTGCGDDTVTLLYVDAITVSTLTMSPVTTVSSPSSSAVSTASATASASANRVTVTATAKDAAGTLLAGVPVTLSVPTGVSLYSLTPATAYTSASGVASWSVYTTLAGSYKLTATGGGVSSDVYLKRTGGTARVVSVTTSAATAKAGESVVVTVKVADAYGNGVSGAAVEVIGSGAGYFQGISLSGSQTTDTNGEVKVAWISNAAGTATITAKITGNQSADAAGYIGTTTAAAGFPAGVASATATVTYGAADTSALDTVKTQVAGLTTTITSIQTAISTLVASVTATLTSMSAQINKIMKKLNIK